VDDSVFRALGHPARREILDRLYERDGQTLGELERAFEMTRFGVMKHLRVLEEAGLVISRKAGRERLHYLNPVPIRELHDRWIGKFAAGASSALLALRAGLEEGSRTMETMPSHVFAVYIRTTPERVWEGITTSEFTTRYYYSSAVESTWTPGSPLVYGIDGEPHILGEVVESDPPRRLVTTFAAKWDDDVAADEPTRVTWEIEPAGPGVTKVTVVHDGFDGDTATYRSVSEGWPLILSGLKTLLETGQQLMPAQERQNA
jgi:uncharacterized protein YndB with AHSA1/START domain/DNA-binding transcriptional ArsR family regulator